MANRRPFPLTFSEVASLAASGTAQATAEIPAGMRFCGCDLAAAGKASAEGDTQGFKLLITPQGGKSWGNAQAPAFQIAGDGKNPRPLPTEILIVGSCTLVAAITNLTASIITNVRITINGWVEDI
jgi:hypothetical protein